MKRSKIAAAIIIASGCANAMAATYQVTPVPLQNIARDNFGQSIDNAGKMISIVDFEYNPPVDLEQLENDTNFFDTTPLENADDVRNGIFSNSDYTVIYNFLISSRGFNTGQQLAANRSYITDTVSAELVPGFDVVTDKFDDYTQSVITLARDSSNGNFIVGSSEGAYVTEAYEQDDGTFTNYSYNDVVLRAFAQVNGETTALLPTDTTLGGVSEAFAVNDNFQVVGYGSVDFNDSVDELIANCETGDSGQDVPLGFCLYSIRASSQAFRFQAKIRPMIWQLNSSGELVDTTVYPLAFTPEADDETFYVAQANDINNNGIAVGFSQTGEVTLITRPQSNRGFEPETIAVTYQNGETTEILPREENLTSEAHGINDNNWVVGEVLRARNEIARSRLFAYNLDSGESKYPDGFFIGSGVTVNAVNNNNIVVGKGDIESSNEAVREARAFMYKIDTDEFIDLNSLISCDSEYTLLEAIDINDQDEIIANARVKQPSTYITGEEALNSAGETVLRDNIVAVKLSPLANGEIDQCEEVGGQDLERQAASLSSLWLLLLGGFGVWRRLKTKH